jgi:hypothetical protein
MMQLLARLRGMSNHTNKLSNGELSGPPLLTTKRDHLASLAQGSGCALHNGERLVALEGVTDVLGAFLVNAVVCKTVCEGQQGATTNCQRPADNKAGSLSIVGAGKRARP